MISFVSHVPQWNTSSVICRGNFPRYLLRNNFESIMLILLCNFRLMTDAVSFTNGVGYVGLLRALQVGKNISLYFVACKDLT